MFQKHTNTLPKRPQVLTDFNYIKHKIVDMIIEWNMEGPNSMVYIRSVRGTEIHFVSDEAVSMLLSTFCVNALTGVLKDRVSLPFKTMLLTNEVTFALTKGNDYGHAAPTLRFIWHDRGEWASFSIEFPYETPDVEIPLIWVDT